MWISHRLKELPFEISGENYRSIFTLVYLCHLRFSDDDMTFDRDDPKYIYCHLHITVRCTFIFLRDTHRFRFNIR